MTSDDVTLLQEQALAAIKAALSSDAVEALRVQYLGKAGSVTQLMKGLGSLSPEARKEAGQRLNLVKDALTAALHSRLQDLAASELETRMQREWVDITLPSKPEASGSLHPITQVTNELMQILGDMGFTLAVGPDIEDDWHNFSGLNFSPHHPARAMHDTFFLQASETGERSLLRTHTSTVQIRTLQNKAVQAQLQRDGELRFMVHGRVFRCDNDATHTPMFHQMEGFAIARHGLIHMGHLRTTLSLMFRSFFMLPDLPLRMRPSYFPFVEPGAEVDIGCKRGGGELVIGNHGGWLEVGGCGMIHPNVLQNCGIDPTQYSGFAFGLGIDRMAMLKYSIPDLRPMFEGDSRWLRHYAFAPTLPPNLIVGS